MDAAARLQRPGVAHRRPYAYSVYRYMRLLLTGLLDLLPVLLGLTAWAARRHAGARM